VNDAPVRGAQLGDAMLDLGAKTVFLHDYSVTARPGRPLISVKRRQDRTAAGSA
jgi:hypothetical protein